MFLKLAMASFCLLGPGLLLFIDLLSLLVVNIEFSLVHFILCLMSIKRGKQSKADQEAGTESL